MPGIATCPSCQRPLQVPEELLGTLVKCPACGATFTAVAAARTTEPQAAVPPAGAMEHYPPGPADHVEDQQVRGRVAAPALCLILTGSLGMLCSSSMLILIGKGEMKAAFQQAAPADPQLREFMRKMGENAEDRSTVATQVAFVAVNVLIILGGVAMLRRRLYGLAVAASILAIIDVNQCCCLLGLPVGIWSLVVLTRPEVKAAFQ